MRGVGYIYIDEVKNIRSLFLYDEKVIESIVKALGGDIDSILTSITKPPAGLYMRVNLLRASREMVIDMIEREGYRAYSDAVLDEAIYIPIEGPYKVTLRDKVVVADKRASESVMMGSNLYAPGVISCGDVRKGDDVTVVSENGIILANGKALMDCKDAMRIKRGIFVEVLESLYRAAPLRELSVWREGLVYPQSLPSMVASKLLNPEAHEVIIDMCAAPGGKTGHLIELSKGMATIYAIDHSASRIQ
ncbi:MAG: PUA domain-containing protein, partial [Sulfolobales archaeon]